MQFISRAMAERPGQTNVGLSARWQPWQSIAAVFLVGLIGGGLIGGGYAYLRLAQRSESTADAVLAGHLRALAAPEPFDITSSKNQDVVKPWFIGRTTIVPDAPDLTNSGFPLAGGRVDIVDREPVPTLVYHSDRHVISVTIVPGTSNSPSGEDRHAGSTLEHWNAGDLTYWAVSDLNSKDLRKLVGLLRAPKLSR